MKRKLSLIPIIGLVIAMWDVDDIRNEDNFWEYWPKMLYILIGCYHFIFVIIMVELLKTLIF